MWFIICALILYKPHELAHWGRDKWTPFRRRHFQVHFWNENVWIPINISLKFVLKGPINNITAFVQVMACRWPGDKPLSEPMVVRLPKHICATRPQWVNCLQIHTIRNIKIAQGGFSIRKGTIYLQHSFTLPYQSTQPSAGPCLNIKTVLSTYGDFHVKDKTAVRTSYL